MGIKSDPKVWKEWIGKSSNLCFLLLYWCLTGVSLVSYWCLTQPLFSPLRPSPDDVNQWAQSLDKLLSHKCKCRSAPLLHDYSKVTQSAACRVNRSLLASINHRLHLPPSGCVLTRLPLSSFSDGKMIFCIFLKSEFCEENIEFWTACEEFSSLTSHKELVSMANSIYEEFIKSEAPKEVTANRCLRLFTAMFLIKYGRGLTLDVSLLLR